MAKKIRYASRATAKTKAEEFEKADELPKMSIAETRDALVQAYDYINSWKNIAFCPYCDSFKKRELFYTSTDPKNKSGLTPICKECCRKIARRVDEQGQEHTVTKESLQEMLFYMNKPFVNTIWDASVQESQNELTGKMRSDVFASYVKNIALPQFYGLGYRDSDFFKKDGSSSVPVFYADEREQAEEYHLSTLSEEEVDEFSKNKSDVIRLIGFDPFAMELPEDQPYLYSQLVGMIDSGGEQNEDMMRIQSCISICRGFLQASKIDNSITILMADVKNIEQNSGSIKSLQASKKDIMSYITSLAAESQISLKTNKLMNQRGMNTWTGRIKRIADIDLREGRVNGFDIETSKAMRQVADLSNASILEMLKLDDSEWSDMVAEMRERIIKMQRQLDEQAEISRILLTENLDLKDFIEEKEIKMNGYSYVDLEDLFARYTLNESDDNDRVSFESVDTDSLDESSLLNESEVDDEES